ncbi:MAG: dehydrogenase [Rhodospirillaceae bacterium]|nr:dehydrogenase [Rhodospirillaceae bacterium]
MGLGMERNYHASVCPHDCPSTCALEVQRLDSRTIGRIRGATANNYTAGVVCAKVARYSERVHHPERLMYPLIRSGDKGDGNFTRVSWEEALDRVSEAFKDKAAQYGSETVWPYYFAGTMGIIQRDGIQRLRHTMRYSRQAANICTELVQNGWIAGAGGPMGPDPRELAKSDLIIVWGGNPVSTQVNVMTHITRARKERGAKLIVVDAYRSPTAEVADELILVKPGTDGAVAAAIMHVLFRDGFADKAYMQKYTDNWQELERHLRKKTPSWAETISGVKAAQIESVAEEIGRTNRTYIRIGYGFARSRNGSSQVHAVASIAAVGGKFRYLGGGAFWSNRLVYHWDKTVVEGLDALDPNTRVLDMSRIGPVLTYEDEVVKKGSPVTAMLVQNTNPAVVAPDTHRVLKGLKRDDLFLCVHEQFLTETAQLADVVLPATTFLEHDDIYQAGGQMHVQIHRAVIDSPGETRSNHWVIGELAKRLGVDHEGFLMNEWELIDRTLRDSGWPNAEEMLKKKWHDVQPSFEEAHFLNGFPTETGRFQFSADWSALGPLGMQLPAFPDYCQTHDRVTKERPFRMITSPARNYLNSSFTETPTSRKREEKPKVMLHPKAAAELSIKEGDRVRLFNGQGSVVIQATIFDGIQADVIVVESVWPNSAFEEGIGINALISADPGAPNGGAVFHDTTVGIIKL